MQRWIKRFSRRIYLVDAISYSKVEGKPFKQSEIENKVLEVLK